MDLPRFESMIPLKGVASIQILWNTAIYSEERVDLILYFLGRQIAQLGEHQTLEIEVQGSKHELGIWRWGSNLT